MKKAIMQKGVTTNMGIFKIMEPPIERYDRKREDKLKKKTKREKERRAKRLLELKIKGKNNE